MQGTPRVPRPTWALVAAAIFGGPYGYATAPRAPAPPTDPPSIAAAVARGFSTSSIVLQLRPGVAPIQLQNGRVSVGLPRGGLDEESEAVGALLSAARAQAITPALAEPPKDAALAAKLGLDRYYLLTLPEGTDTPELAAALARHPLLIDRAEPEAFGSTDTLPPDTRLWALQNTGQVVNGVPGTPGADIKAARAWALHVATPDVIIAILDTGVSQSHPNLAGIQVAGASFDPNSPANSDDNGIPSHGSMCAGIAAAASVPDNSYVGVAYGARIMPVKVATRTGAVGVSWVANGVLFASDHGANVISMSLSFTSSNNWTSFFHDACQYAHDRQPVGAVLVASSGNVPGGTIGYPASWPMVMCVGATTNQDTLAIFTTTGPQMDVCAPGQDIWCCIDEDPALGGRGLNTFAFDSGTSMAAPHVAGLAALLFSANPTLSNDRVRFIIESSADDLGPPGADPQFGNGRINSERAMRQALSLPLCLADWNNDGLITPADVAQFTNDWWVCVVISGSLAADVTGDGMVSPDDIAMFLQMWTDALLHGC